MRRFELHREQDASGVSGTGTVAQGVQFDDGTCVLRWLTEHSSTAVYASARDVELIHGHGGLTRLVWIDSIPRISIDYRPADNDEYLRLLGRRLDVMQRLEGRR